MSGKGFIAYEGGTCTECLRDDLDTRPVGPDGRRVCFPCMNAHPEWWEEGKRRQAERLGLDPTDIPGFNYPHGMEPPKGEN